METSANFSDQPEEGLLEARLLPDDSSSFHNASFKSDSVSLKLESSSFRLLPTIFDLIDKYWFLVGIALAIWFAYLVPNFGKKDGWIHSEYTIKYGAISMIFLLSGLTLKTKELKRALFQFRLHLFVQSFNLVFIPLFIFALVQLLKLFSLDSLLAIGFVSLGCLPTSISSCIVLTKNAMGNEAAALFNATFGNIFGLFWSPILLLLLLGSNFSSVSSVGPIASILFNLALTVAMPLLVGQIMLVTLPNSFEEAVFRNKTNISRCSNLLLLLIIWSTFCDTFAAPDSALNISMVGIAIGIILFLQCVFLSIVYGLSGIRFLHLSRGDRVCALFAGTQKTIALGVSIIGAIFSENPYWRSTRTKT